MRDLCNTEATKLVKNHCSRNICYQSTHKCDQARSRNWQFQGLITSATADFIFSKSLTPLLKCKYLHWNRSGQ